ncbi:hypothetical protein KPL71_004915 [Citrus sinensis]|nr:hypothetical protein KPL71_004915 [Citrus sinensis]
MKSRRKEDSKANARVVEIFVSHSNTWQAEEKQLLQQINVATEEMASLRSKIEELEREKLRFDKRFQELEDMIGFMSRRGYEFEVEQQILNDVVFKAQVKLPFYHYDISKVITV